MTIIVDGEFRGTSRFRVIRRLGGGGFGIVYRVYDNKRRSEVALKTLKVANPRALYRFKKEFRALADVNHVNLVSLYELLSEEGVWFFTMELVDGPNFRDYVLGEPPPEASDSDVPTAQDATLDFSKSSAHDVVARAIRQAPTTDFIKLRHALKQLAEGLGALHRAGMLHRDIKPTNVRVTTNDRVVVLDFGLVTEADPHNMMHSVDFVGSPAYMSPEQGTGKPVSEAGDWYSVGVMLFEALTGQLPFFGGFTEVLLAKQQQEAPSPASLSSGVPDDLNQLCVGLLRRDPRDRIKGRDVLQLLGATTPPRRFVESVSSSHRSEMLYGRERHTAALATAFERALSGTPTTVLVRGRSGMGKTTLIETFLREIQRASSDVVALTGRCYQQELVPYKALDGLIDSLSRYLTRQNQLEAAMLMPRDILALARLFPVLRQVEVIDSTTSRGAPIADPHELRRRAFEALRELLARLADRKRVVLFIDDLQWGDDDSVSLLSQLLRPPSAPVLLLIVSHRDGPGHDNRLLQELFSTPSPGSEALDLHEITVGPLSPDEALAMARQLLRDSTLTGGQTAEELARESSGIPLFLAELVRYAREKSGDSTQPTSEDPETTLQSLLEIRLSRLPQNSLKLLRVLCIFGQPLAVGQAYQAARLSDSDREPLNRLVNDSLVRFTRQRRDSEEVEPQHDRIRETVLFQMSESDVRGITRSLAESFEKLDTTEPEILGQFYERVGDAEKTAVYMAQAAEKAAGQLAFHHAAELFRRALANSSTVEMAQHLTTRLAEVLISLGRGVEAARLFLSAVENADETTAIHLRRRAADQLLRSGHFDEGIAALRTVLDAQKQAWPETPSKAIWSLVRSRARLWLRGLRFTRRHENAIDPELLERIETTWSAAIGMSMIDVFRGADFQTRNLLYALQAGDPYRVSRAMSMEAAFVASFGLPSRDKSEMLMTLARDLADEIGHPHARALSLLVEGVASFLWGEWTRCFKFCERSEKMFRDECTGVAWELANCKIYSFASLFYMGELGDMMHGMPIYLREAREVGDLYSSAMLRTFFHNAVLLADDNPRLAQQNLKEVGESWSHDGFHVQHFFQMLAQASVLLYESDPMAAWDHINGRLPALRSSQLHRIQFVRCELAYIVGRVALSLSATGYEREAMLGVASKQALLLERERADWAAPYALLLQSGVLAQRGDIEAAIVSLASAERGFDQQSMALFGACARRRRGGLLHGDHGRKLVRESEAMMSTQKIRNPQRWTELFVPGSSNLEGSE